MKINRLIITCLIILSTAVAVNAQSLVGKTATELEAMQKDAIAKEDYDLAEKIKHQLALLAENNRKIEKLEKEKETAILIEDYDRVIEIDKEIEALKRGETYVKEAPVPAPVPTPAPVITPPPVQTMYKAPAASSFTINDEARYDMTKKNLGSLGFGYRSVPRSYYSGYYETDQVSLDGSVDFIWMSKYLTSGIYYSFGGDWEDNTAFEFGMELKALADFEAVILPYSSVGLGFSYHIDDGAGPSFIYKVGSYLFFSKARGFGVFYEANINIMYFDDVPINRFGIVFSGVKMKHRYK